MATALVGGRQTAVARMARRGAGKRARSLPTQVMVARDERSERSRVHRLRAPCAAWLAVCGALLASPALGEKAAAAAPGPAALSSEDLAKKLANPVAAMISVPFQLNYDQDIGSAREGERWTLNIQPVIPVDIAADWNLISRTIVPVTWQDEVFPGAGSQFGLGDVLQSVFFSPKKPTAGGWIWGAGPVLLLPTGTDDLLSARKWGAGPTGVALRQAGPWTFGALANHVWSFAGDSSRPSINSSYVQPFVSYTTPTAWSFALNTESSYNWQSEQWSVPVNAIVSKVFQAGGQTLSVGAGARYWADSPDAGPHGWGLRLIVTLLFPK